MIFKCPVCEGQGVVSKPPWIAGDQQTWIASSTLSYPCKRCGGIGTINDACDNCKKLEAENQQLQTKLDAWQAVFGTSQLTHAQARLECAEATCQLLKTQRVNLRNELDRLLAVIGKEDYELIVKCLEEN